MRCVLALNQILIVVISKYEKMDGSNQCGIGDSSLDTINSSFNVQREDFDSRKRSSISIGYG